MHINRMGPLHCTALSSLFLPHHLVKCNGNVVWAVGFPFKFSPHEVKKMTYILYKHRDVTHISHHHHHTTLRLYEFDTSFAIKYPITILFCPKLRMFSTEAYRQYRHSMISSFTMETIFSGVLKTFCLRYVE